MKLVIEIEMDNAAFHPCPCYEVARILRAFAKRVSTHVWEPNLCGGTAYMLDINGNTVGTAEVANSDDDPDVDI